MLQDDAKDNKKVQVNCFKIIANRKYENQGDRNLLQLIIN